MLGLKQNRTAIVVELKTKMRLKLLAPGAIIYIEIFMLSQLSHH